MAKHTRRLLNVVLMALFFAGLVSAAANAAPVQSAGSPIAAGTALPAALRPVLYHALARDAGSVYAVAENGCATLPKQLLEGCFTAAGASFTGSGNKSRALRLIAWGRGTALHAVAQAAPAIEGNRVIYAHGALTEWWRVLPLGFEQGFTIARCPAGAGRLRLVIDTNGPVKTDHGALAFGKLRYGQLVVTDARGKVVPATLSADKGRVLIAVNDAHAAYPLTIDPLVWSEQDLTASDGQVNDQFGHSVALAGATALIGASAATGGGAAYVFNKSNGTWTQTQELTASGTFGFGSSVVLDGTTAIIGASYTTVGSNSEQGAAYVFTESGGTWTQTQELTASDGAAYDIFGYSVALDGTTALIGAIQDDVPEVNGPGKVYVFTDEGGTWTQTQEFTSSDGVTGDDFGASVGLSAGTALVGARHATVGGKVSQGAAYIFTDVIGNWTQTQKLTASDGAGGDYFGQAIALQGTTALIGAPGHNAKGFVYAFTKSGGTWTQATEFSSPSGASGDLFGASVALDGSSALIGAPGANFLYGAAYVFTESGGIWSQSTELAHSNGTLNDGFGDSGALDGITALVGAPFESGTGAASVYAASCPQGYNEHDGTLNAGGFYVSTPYQAPAGQENGILGGSAGFQLYAQYSNGTSPHTYRIPGNEIHTQGPAGTYRWGAKAGNTGGAYVLCVLHP